MLAQKLITTAIFSAIITLNVACSTVESMFSTSPAFYTQEEGKEQLNDVDAVSNIFSTNRMVNVTKASDEAYLFDDSNADVYRFPTGKSFYRVFQLPLNAQYLAIEFQSTISTTTFIPRVDFYNKNKQLVSTLKSSAFKFRDSQLGNGYIVGKLVINNVSAKPGHEFAYMVVYTTDEALETTTAIIHPAVKQAIALRNSVPDLPDVQVPHSNIGEVNIEFKFRQKDDDFTDDLISYLDKPLFGGDANASNRDENVVLATGEVYAVSSQSVGSTAVKSYDSNGQELAPTMNDNPNMTVNTSSANNNNTVVAGSMLKETEELYNRLIKEAIASGDLTKAMNLVSEAQRAGSVTAQKTFVDEVEKRTKTK